MVPLLWLLLSCAICLLELLILTQPEWLVNGTLVQGLYAVCDRSQCYLRETKEMAPLVCQFLGSILFLGTVMAMFPSILCSNKSLPIHVIANIQFLAAVLLVLCVICFPLDSDSIHCTMSQLIHSTTCRVGWAYAVGCVCAMVSLCCPVMGRLVAENRSRFAVDSTRNKEYYI